MEINATIPAEVAQDLIVLTNSLGSLEKDAVVSYKATKFAYVTLDSMLGCIKRDKNFAFGFILDHGTEGLIKITPRLVHKSGAVILGGTLAYSEASMLPSGASALTPQGMGSVITYCKRYATAAFFGIASDDDTDATEQAPARPAPKAPTASRPAPAPAPANPWTEDQCSELSKLRQDLADLGVTDILTVFDNHRVDRSFMGKRAPTQEEAGAWIAALRAEISATLAEQEAL